MGSIRARSPAELGFEQSLYVNSNPAPRVGIESRRVSDTAERSRGMGMVGREDSPIGVSPFHGKADFGHGVGGFP